MTAAAFVLPILLLTAQDKKSALPPGIPPTAWKVDDTTYKAKEKDGKIWVYRRTPFGISRLSEEQFNKQAEAPLIKPSKEASVKVTDLGSEYRFERAHPFGVQAWKKAKNALTDDEKAFVQKASVEKAQTETAKPETKK